MRFMLDTNIISDMTRNPAGRAAMMREGDAVLPLDVSADAEYAVLRAELEAAGPPVGHNDLFIAAHACVLGSTLVTANTGEFGRIRKLKVENWLE